MSTRWTRFWATWLEGDPELETANAMVNVVGVAFGQCLVDDFDFAWKVITDEYGTEMAVYAEPGGFTLFPPNLVAKRWETRETGFLRPMYEMVAEKRHSPSPRPKKKRFGRS